MVTDAYEHLIHPLLDDGTNDKGATEKFGSLKTTLVAIPAVYANHNVRSAYSAKILL